MALKKKDTRLHWRLSPEERQAVQAFCNDYGYKDPTNLARVAVFGLIHQVTGKPLMGGSE